MSIDGGSSESLLTPNDRIILRSEKDSVVLKQLIPEDAPHYFKLVDEGRKHLSRHRDRTSRKYPTEESVLNSIVNPDDPRKLRFGIWDGDTMVGSVNLIVIKEQGIGVTGSWIGEKHTGHNFAARGRDILIDYAFNHLGLKFLESQIHKRNIASQKSVEKSGFKLKIREGKWLNYELLNPNLPKSGKI